MADYLTQPSSTESAVSKVRKIRSELQKQKAEVSKKREKFAKRTLGLEAGMAIGNAALKGALNRYQLRNQPEVNLLKGLQAQSKGVIEEDLVAMPKWGTSENYIFNMNKERWKEEIGLKASEGYIYSSDHWSDELKADVAEKTKAYDERLIAARRIAEGDVDNAFAGLKERALPSNLWSWFSRSAKQAVRGHDATTIKLKADQSFNKLIDNPIFAAHKDFQIQAKLYNSYFPGALQGVLADIEKEAKAGTLQDRVGQTQFVSKLAPRVDEVTVNGKKSKITSQRYTVDAVQTTPTGKLLPAVKVVDREFKAGEIPLPLITSEQLKAYNMFFVGRGQTRYLQKLDEKEDITDPFKVYMEVMLEGDEIGRKNGTNVNPYLKPDIDITELMKGYYLEAGKASQAYHAEVSKENYMVDGVLDLEAFNKQVKIRDELIKNYFTQIAKGGAHLKDAALTPNVVIPPKP